MLCCVNCFNSVEPKQFIASAGEINDCDFCGSHRVRAVDAKDLRSLFEPVLEYYETVEFHLHYLDPDTNPIDLGEQLGYLLQEHWEIFSDTLDGTDECNKLIEAIFDGDLDVLDMWCTVDDRWSVDLDADRSTWNRFASYLKSKRRFFLDHGSEGMRELRERLLFLFEGLEVTLPKSTTIFRSRLGGEDDGDEVTPYSSAKMGAPEPDPNRQGRGNPPGISYMYASSDPETAVAEKRPGRNSLLSLADLDTTKELRLIDLASVAYLSSPFGVEFLEYEIRARRLLRVLSDELSRPVSPDDAPIEYLPSQYLCELILDSGYDGVIYESGFGPGNNYLLFDTESALPKAKVRLVEVRDSRVTLTFGNVYVIADGRLD